MIELAIASTCPQCGCVIEDWEWRCIYCARAPRMTAAGFLRWVRYLLGHFSGQGRWRGRVVLAART
ncbi:MAG: hypothetical protein AB7L09_22145 [Nitrospira sp.]